MWLTGVIALLLSIAVLTGRFPARADGSRAEHPRHESNQQARSDMVQYRYLKKRLLECLQRHALLLQDVKDMVENSTLTSLCDMVATTSSTSSAGTRQQVPQPSASSDPGTFMSNGGSASETVLPGGSLNPAVSETTSSFAELFRSSREAMDRLVQPLRIVLIGHVSHGKTLLINSLLKQQILPSNVGPVSYLSTVVRGSDELEPFALFRDGQRIDLESLAAAVGQPADTLTGSSPGNHPAAAADVNSTVELLWPRSRCAVLAGQDIEMWDTAGYDYTQQVNDVIVQQCQRGDVILAVVDSTMGLSLSLARVLSGFKHASVLLAFTKWDQFAAHVSPARLQSTRTAYMRRANQLVYSQGTVATDAGGDDVTGKESVFFVDSLTYWNDLLKKNESCQKSDPGRPGAADAPCGEFLSLTSKDLSSEGSHGFVDLETALYELAGHNGIQTKLYSGWHVANHLTGAVKVITEDLCSKISQLLLAKRRSVASWRQDLHNSPSVQKTVLQDVDAYVGATLSWKVAMLSSVLDDASRMERDMLDGVDKEAAAHQHLQRLNDKLLSGGEVADRTVHEVRVRRLQLLESAPAYVHGVLDVLLRQSTEPFQLLVSDCALAEFQASPVILVLYAVMRVACVLLVAYLFLLFQPLRRAASIITGFALLYAVLLGLSFDSDIERTRHFVWHIQRSLQHVTHRRLATVAEQQRVMLHREMREQFVAMRSALELNCARTTQEIGSLVEFQQQCVSRRHDLILLTDYLAGVKELVEFS